LNSIEQVVEELAADRRGIAGGADHGDRPRSQERPHRIDGGLRLPVLEVRDRRVGEQDRELDLDRSRGGPDRHGETAGPEDVDHLVVLGQHLRYEGRDAVPSGLLRHLTEEDRSHPLALELIGRREAHLGAAPLDPDVLGAPDHEPVAALQPRQVR
jgi:hypothetical protein